MLAAVSSRHVFFAIFACCLLLVAGALFMQHFMSYDPCPLCILQRVAIMLVGLVALAATLHNPGVLGQRLYALLTSLTSAAGLALAGRHIWLQYFADKESLFCGPSLDYLLESFPLMEVLSIALRGTGDCSEISTLILGMSIPTWVLIFCGGFFVLSAWLMARRLPR